MLAFKLACLPNSPWRRGRCCTDGALTPRLRAAHLAARVARRNVLTQFNSHMLNTHLTQAYPPAVLGGPARTGFVDVLACHQTPQFSSWCAASGCLHSAVSPARLLVETVRKCRVVFVSVHTSGWGWRAWAWQTRWPAIGCRRSPLDALALARCLEVGSLLLDCGQTCSTFVSLCKCTPAPLAVHRRTQPRQLNRLAQRPLDASLACANALPITGPRR